MSQNQFENRYGAGGGSQYPVNSMPPAINDFRGPQPNGNVQYRNQGPPGPPGIYGPPTKSTVGPGPIQNGPSSGPMGDQSSLRNGYPQPGIGPSPAGVPNEVPPPMMRPSGQQPMTNQMAAMNISSGQPPQPGSGYPNVPPNQGIPPTNFPTRPQGPHPGSGGMQAPPPSNTAPPRQQYTSNVPPPMGNMPGQPGNTSFQPPVIGSTQPPPLNTQPPVHSQPASQPRPPQLHQQPPQSQPLQPPHSQPLQPPHSQPPQMLQTQPVGSARFLPPNSMPPTASSSVGDLPPPPSSMGNSVYNQNYPTNAYQHPSQQPPPQPVSQAAPPGYNFNAAGAAPPPGGVAGPGYPAGPVPRAPTPSGPMAGPAQPRKLDPDQMPSPIQVIEDDKRLHSAVFQTTPRGGAPPLVTSNFIVEDQGNASPRFIRSTMYNIPVSSDMINTAKIPFAATITPFAKLLNSERPPPVVDLGQLGPIRCNRCKAYMCPYMQFIDGGRRFQCVFCNCNTEVPAEYFAHLDHTGRRTDSFERPELCLGTYELVATTDYCKENKLPNPPAFIFMIDVSYNSVKSGLVNLMCERLKEEVLFNLPKEFGAEESEVRVGFVTYHKELHFYNVKASLAQPQMMVVSDIEDVFVPLLDGFLVKLSESEAVIDSLLSQIPSMFAESRETEIVLGPVIQAGLDALKSAECAGKLFIFHSSLPVAQAPGSLKNRDDRKLLGTDKEKTILSPQTNFYTKLGQECVTAGCGVELFLFPNSYIDLATVSEVPRLTGGGVHKFQYFQADLNGNQFIDDLRRVVEKPVAFDCVMRVRTSTGIRPVDFFGNFYMSNTTDVELATIDCDKAVTVEIKHDDKLSETEGAYLQAAVLYTSVGGQRRLRIINQSYNCCTQMADLFRNCELDTLINYMAKYALRQTLNGSPKQVREHIMSQCAQVLACYRQKCASPSSAGQLILPECMKLLPLYSNCVLKSNMLQGGGDISTDDRSLMMFLVNSMSVKSSQSFFYPRLLPLHTLDLDATALPVSIRCSYERLQDNGAYLIENGSSMLMWVGHNISAQWVQDVFGVHSAAQIDIDKTKLEELDNPLSKRVQGIVNRVREERQKFIRLIIVRQRDKLEPIFQQYLVEDRGANGTASYVDFLCHIHKEIRNLLN